MLLLTGATGLIGSALLRRLTVRGAPVRCLVRDARRLGAERVRVQIAIGDLADPSSFRHALRGVHTVVHLAASDRDQPHATIEELNGLATWRLLRAAEAAGVEHFVFVTPLGAAPWHAARVHRAKALAEEAVAAADLRTTTVATSLVYAPDDRRLIRLERLALLPAVPLAGRGTALSQPIWAEDVADCLLAAAERHGGERHARYELAGPQTLSHREAVRIALHAFARRRRLVPVPLAVLRRILRTYETLTGPAAFATYDEAVMLAVEMTTPRGTADAEALGVRPLALPAVLGGALAGG